MIEHNRVSAILDTTSSVIDHWLVTYERTKWRKGQARRAALNHNPDWRPDADPIVILIRDVQIQAHHLAIELKDLGL